MHVLYFHQHFSTPKGAAGTRSYEMAQSLLRSGHNVTIVCGSYAQGMSGLTMSFERGKRRGVVDGIDVIEFDLSYSNDLGFFARFVVFVKFALNSIGIALREPCDVVFATSTPLTAGIPGIVAKWLRRKTFVFEVRDLWPELPKAMGVISNPLVLLMMSWLEWLSYRSADRLIGLSPGIVEGIESRGVAKSRIVMVPNGCDLDLFGEVDRSWRPEGVHEDQLLALFAGTHGIANDLDAILDAASVLKLRGRDDIRFVLVGQGREKSRLKERADIDKIHNVLFLDPVPKTTLVRLMAGADIGLQVLRNVPEFYFGTSPNKFFDYISAGLPVLINYPGWLEGLISENDCGYFVDPGDSQAFAEALIDATENRERLLLMSQNSRKLAEISFSRETLSEKWIKWVVEGKHVDDNSEKH